MAQTSTSGRLFENSLRKLVKDIVWKNGYKSNMGDKSDNVDSIVVDTYTSGARYLLMFYTQSTLEMVEDFSRAEYIAYLNNINEDHKRYFDMFYFGKDLVSIAAANNQSVNNLRANTVKYPHYEEKNDYHRMLFGLPPLNCHDRYIIWYENGKNADGSIKYEPLHKLPYIKRFEANAQSLINRFIDLSEKDHTYDYAKYMTRKRIHPFVSRLAGRFDLLYIGDAELESLTKDFKEVYQECTQFMILRYYSEAYRNQYEFYEGFIGISILFMTLQRMQSKYLEADMTRDFYDSDSIKVVYEAYSVPFFDEIPVTYHHKIIKAINRLISYKGSNTAFRELFDIFEFANLKIYQYYLLKRRILDEKGNPLFIYDEDGNLDPRRMYELTFVQGDIGDTPYKYIIDDNNDHNYIGVTSEDPYWINDGPLYDKIYNTEFNFIETKYIGVRLAYSLTRYLLESSYFMRMLIDNREATSKIQAPGDANGLDIYTLVIYIHAIICKVIGVDGAIRSFIEDPTKMAAVYGYNFVGDLSVIYPYLCRQFFANGNFSAVDDSISDKTGVSKERMVSIWTKLTTKTENARLFECFINDVRISSSLGDDYCAACGTKRDGNSLVCTNPNCIYGQADTDLSDNDGVIHTVFTKKLISQDDFYNSFEKVYRDEFKNQLMADRISGAIEARAKEMAGKYVGAEYKIMVEKYMADIISTYVEDKMRDFKNLARSYINGEADVVLPNYFTGHWHYICAKELRAISLIKNYITGVTDTLDPNDSAFTITTGSESEVEPFITPDELTYLTPIKKWLEEYFKPSKDRDLASIINTYFLNNTYIKTEDWGVAEGDIAGINARSKLETNEHAVLINIMNIIRNDITINKGGGRSIADINKSYLAIIDLCNMKEFTSRTNKGLSIDRLLWTTKNPKTYYALKRIRQMLLTTQIASDAYRKSDGKVADTYYDLLYDINPLLAIDMDTKMESQLLKDLDYALASIKKLCSDLIYIQSYGSVNTQRIIDYIYSLIRFFKSAKVELIDFSMQYTIDGRTMNLVKLMSTISRGDVYTTLTPDEIKMYDLISDICHEVMVRGGDLTLDDYAKLIYRYFTVKGSLYFADTVAGSHESLYSRIDEITFNDIMNYALRETQLSNKFTINDAVTIDQKLRQFKLMHRVDVIKDVDGNIVAENDRVPTSLGMRDTTGDDVKTRHVRLVRTTGTDAATMSMRSINVNNDYVPTQVTFKDVLIKVE